MTMVKANERVDITFIIMSWRICKIFAVWVAFMEAILSFLNFKPDDILLAFSKSEVFNKTGNDLTDICLCLN